MLLSKQVVLQDQGQLYVGPASYQCVHINYIIVQDAVHCHEENILIYFSKIFNRYFDNQRENELEFSNENFEAPLSCGVALPPLHRYIGC